MILTPKQAKKKRCRQNSLYHINGLGTKVHAMNCIADECMHWAWYDKENTKGYCGLCNPGEVCPEREPIRK